MKANNKKVNLVVFNNHNSISATVLLNKLDSGYRKTLLAKIGMEIIYNRASQVISGEEYIFLQSLADQYCSKKIKLIRKVTFFKKTQKT